MPSSKPLDGKVAIVTGGSRGIGRATALQLAADGAKVVVNHSNSTAAADELVALIGADKAFAIRADAGNIEEIGKLVDGTVQKFGKIDIIVACAAIMPLAELDKVSEAEYDNAFALNVKGPLFLAQKAVPHMSSGGRMVFFSSTLCTASTVTANYLVYCSSKGAIEQMTRVMSKDLARKGIMVNCISPGPTGTELFLNGKSEQMLKFIAGLNPQGRLGTPEDIAQVVGFMSGPACGWMTGQNLKVNGGMA